MTRHDEASGFTLIELLIAIVLAGVVSIAIGTALLIGFKTTFATAQTVSQSDNAQQLSQYFNGDVQSASANGVNTLSGTQPGCSGAAAPGTNLIQLSWTDTATAKQYAAGYRRAGTLITRYFCEVGTLPTIANVSHDVTAASVSVSGIRVTMIVTVEDPTEYLGPGPYTFSVSGSRRTPGSSCSVNGTSIVISPVPVALTPGAHLSSPVTVTFTTDGVCSGATVSYQYGAAGANDTVTATTAGVTGSWSATIPSSTHTWTEGAKAVVITSGTTTGTSSFAVYDPTSCVLTTPAPTASPNPANEASGVLVATTVTFTTTGTCHGATTGSVTFQYGATATDVDTAPATIVSVVGSTTSWRAILPPVETTMWTPGVKPFTVTADVASGSGSFTVNVAPVCMVAVGSITPTATPVYLAVGQTGSGQLRNSLAVSFQTTGPCSSASLMYQYGATAAASTTLAAVGGPTTWTVTIPVSPPGGSYTTGAKTLTAAAGASSATGSFTVADGCALVTPITFSGNPATVKSNGDLNSPVIAAFATNAACGASDLPAVTYQYGSSAQTRTASAVAGSPTQNPDGTLNWTATFVANLGGSTHWTTGTKTVTIPLGSPTPTATFTVN